MEKQTSIPLKESMWNKKRVAIPLTFIVGILIFWGLSVLGGESKASNPEAQSPAAEETYKQWEAERDSRDCQEQKKVAQANYNDVLNGFKVNKDMNSLKAKIEKDCGWNVVPVTKALSFEESDSFGLVHSNIQQKPVTSIAKQTSEKHPVHHGSPAQQKYIDYAWNTYHDKNLIYLLKAENGLITPERMHPRGYYCRKRIAHDWGFGGISDCYHPNITSDPRFFSDPYWQIDQVYRLYKGGTKFYSKPNWPKMAKHFDWVI